MMKSLEDKSILLIIAGGIAAYKSLELIRLIKKSGAHVRCILTNGGQQFVTPLSVAALSEETVYTNIFSLKDETEMGHIRLSREADLIVIAPATANLLAQMAWGLADDLASAVLLAADKPVLVAPAMNYRMWEHSATRENIEKLKQRGVMQVGPAAGDMACGESGMGRMSEPEDIMDAIYDVFLNRPLKGRKALVTSGPTFEAIDPVRFIGNRSSGKQGHAIAEALALAGADVTLISGPVSLKDPENVKTIHIESAEQMLNACESALPADIAICAAAVSDWLPKAQSAQKLKKREDQTPPTLTLKENPDILHTISTHQNRPSLVIGFAAETQDLLTNAAGKLDKKRCDWILANNVSDEKVFGSHENHVYLVSQEGSTDWGKTTKTEIARKLTEEIIKHVNTDA